MSLTTDNPISAAMIKRTNDIHMIEDHHRKKKFSRIILAYPIALILIGLVANLLILGARPALIAMPAYGIIVALVISCIALLANHTWLMTSTELTRLKYDLHATPEEWETSRHVKADASHEGLMELERRHNAHGNATENVVHFVFLALLVSVVSPVVITAQVWIAGFTIGRLGHAFSYLAGRDGLRGLFMSLSLVSLYGLASYLVVSLVV